jgi:hypothetical protein
VPSVFTAPNPSCGATDLLPRLPDSWLKWRTFYRNHGEVFLAMINAWPKGLVESFCHKVIEAGLSHLPWYCISRLDTVDGPVLELTSGRAVNPCAMGLTQVRRERSISSENRSSQHPLSTSG